MEGISREIVYPTFEQIIDANRQIIRLSGGSFFHPDNLRNPDSLIYILDAIRFPIFGHDMFPMLEEKAAALGHGIISRHVFHDGNKRTGMHITWEFLQANGVNVFFDWSVIELAVALADGSATRNDLLEWLSDHVEC